MVRAALSGFAGAGSPHVLGDAVRVVWSGPADDAEGALRRHLASAGLTALEIRPITPDMETAFAVLAEAAR